jgi:hypothetical protein
LIADLIAGLSKDLGAAARLHGHGGLCRLVGLASTAGGEQDGETKGGNGTEGVKFHGRKQADQSKPIVAKKFSATQYLFLLISCNVVCSEYIAAQIGDVKR